MLTVLIPTFNEAENLEKLLPLVQWADEILVVDSFSTDDTVAIAQKHGARVIQRVYDYPGYQKNWGIPQARNAWVFIVDADERPTPALIEEIKKIIQQPARETVAYWIGRENYFLNQRIRYSGWQGDKVIRLIWRDKCCYGQERVHEEIVAEGKVGQLQHKLQHFTYRSLQHFLAKMERYADWSALDHSKRTRRVGFFHLYLKPAFRFFKHYILQRGFLDGRAGLIVSVVMAWGVFLRYAKLYEKRGGVDC